MTKFKHGDRVRLNRNHSLYHDLENIIGTIRGIDINYKARYRVDFDVTNRHIDSFRLFVGIKNERTICYVSARENELGFPLTIPQQREYTRLRKIKDRSVIDEFIMSNLE